MIIDIVKHITTLLDVNGFKYGFGHGPQHWSNLINDEFDFGEFDGTCFLDQPITTTYQVTSGSYIGETYTINLFFMIKSEDDWTPEQHEEFCINPANDAVRQFISLCQNSDDIIDTVTDPTALEFINLLDVNVSGKSLTVTLKSRFNVSACTNAVPTFCRPAIDLIKDSDGLILYTKEIASGQTGTTSILDSDITNSDNTFNTTVVAQGVKVLDDVINVDSDGTLVPTPAQTPFVATLCGGAQSGIAYQQIQFNGDTTSGITGDEAYLMANGFLDNNNPINPTHTASLDYSSPDPFYTLVEDNIFGNKKRYTNSLGLTASYDGSGGELANYAICHLYNIGFDLNIKASNTRNLHLSNSLSSTTLGFTDWFLCTLDVMQNARDSSLFNVPFGGEPFNNIITNIWTSTGRPALSISFGIRSINVGGYNQAANGTSHVAYFCRRHF